MPGGRAEIVEKSLESFGSSEHVIQHCYVRFGGEMGGRKMKNSLIRLVLALNYPPREHQHPHHLERSRKVAEVFWMAGSFMSKAA